jgi:hypothetical protein
VLGLDKTRFGAPLDMHLPRRRHRAWQQLDLRETGLNLRSHLLEWLERVQFGRDYAASPRRSDQLTLARIAAAADPLSDAYHRDAIRVRDGSSASIANHLQA